MDQVTNYGLDTIREEDYLKCKKFYRPGANAAALSSKMNRMNEASEMIDQRLISLKFIRFSVHKRKSLQLITY